MKKTRIVARADAIKDGKTRYFTGKPCKYGHVAERWVVSFSCVACGTEIIRRYRQRLRARLKRNPAKRE